MNTTPHLLIVDDDSEICTLLSSFLAQYGITKDELISRAGGSP